MIVVDASAVVDLLLARAPHGPTIEARLARESPNVAAPHLIDVEVTQVLRRWVHAGSLSESRARAALADLAALPIVRYPHGPLLPRAFDLRNNVTAYDGVYLALAEVLHARLLTLDAALSSIPGSRAVVELIS